MENETITSAVCPQCGAPLTEADENGNMKCEFCGATALDNRHSFVHTSHNFEDDLNHYLENAEILLSDREYNRALDKFNEIASNFSKDYRGWWGMARALTHNFTQKDLDEEIHTKVNKYCTNAIAKAPEDKREELTVTYNEYKAAVKQVSINIKKLYEKFERSEKLIALSFPASIVVYTVFMFVYSIIYNLINNPELGNAGGDIVGVIIPALIFGVAYGIWAMAQDSDNAIFGIYATVALSAIDWGAACSILGQKLGFTHLVLMPLVFAAAFVPGYFMAKKARGY